MIDPNFPYNKPREQQVMAMDFIKKTFLEEEKKFCIIEAGTGVGKSALGVYCANLLQGNNKEKEDGAYFLTTQKILQEQYIKDFYDTESMVSIKSSSNYSCKYYKGSTCGESLRMLKTSDRDSQFFKCCSYGCTYKKEKEKFIDSKKGVTNFSYFLAETLYAGKLKPKNVLVIDEAHNISNELSKFVEVTISEKFCISQKLKFPEKVTQASAFNWIKETYHPYLSKRLKHINGMLDKYQGLKDKLNDLQKLSKNYDLLDKHVCKINRFIERYNKENWIFNLIEADGRSKKKIEFKPIDVSSYAHEHLFDRADRVLMLSATILNKDGFCELLGIKRSQCNFLNLESPFPIENRPIITAGIGKMSSQHIDSNLPKLALAIDSILEEHKNEKGIIHCHSYKIANFLKNNIKNKNRLIYHNSENRDEAIKKHEKSKKSSVLISPSMTEGVDLKDDLSRFQILCKIPYPYLGDKLIRKKMNRWKWWYPLQTAKTIIQSVGRSVRSKEDFATTYILDEDWFRFYRNNKSLFPKDFQMAIK